MQDYLADNWREALANNGLTDFDAWWELDAGWFEEPNVRRGGWSGVSRLELEMADGSQRAVFLKRQENHVTRTLLHPLRGIPTFIREMKNIQALQAASVPALVPVYFATRTVGGAQRAILVTEALDGFVPLDEINRQALSVVERRQLVEQVAEVLKRLHAQRLQHNCLYPKHLFVKQQASGFEVRLIDLEKTKRCLFRNSAMFRDLDTLNRHACDFSRVDRLRFVKSYLDTDARGMRLRKLWTQLAKRANKKKQRRQSRIEASA
jgi:tRNA A-37 threonylcarbamoyl transferase component Bud32